MPLNLNSLINQAVKIGGDATQSLHEAFQWEKAAGTFDANGDREYSAAVEIKGLWSPQPVKERQEDGELITFNGQATFFASHDISVDDRLSTPDGELLYVARVRGVRTNGQNAMVKVLFR